MSWNLNYDYCALFALTLFGVYFYSMRQIKSRLNKMFNLLFGFTFAAIIMDLVSSNTVMYLSSYGVALAYLANVLYFILLDIVVYFFYMYILVYTENYKKNKHPMAAFGPMAVSLLMVLTTPWLHLLISISDTNEQIYRYGVLYPLHVAVLFGYVAYALFLTIKYRKKISKTRLTAILSSFVVLLTAALLQHITKLIWPEKDAVLLVGIAMAFSIVSLYLSQYSTGDSIDIYTNAFNKKTFYLSTSAHIDEKHEFSVIAFEPDNFNEIIKNYGEDMANVLLHQISEFLHSLVSNQAVYKLDGNAFAILLGARDKFVNEETFLKYYYASNVFQGNGMGNSEEARIVLQALSERFDHYWTIGEEKIRLSACICYLRYPDDVTRADEVNDVIEAALRQAHEVGNGTILYAAEYTQTRETYINELQAKQAELEEASRAAEEARAAAERADNSKTKFLANMSHEIRTPMNAIMGMTELVLRDDINDQVRKNMDNIQSAGNTLLTIINDILDFSKIEAGKMEVINGSYETASLLNNVLSVSAARLNGKNLELRVEVDPTVPSRFKGDEMRLRQIIINLMGNAIKYTEAGSVTLKMGWERIETASDNPDTNRANLVVSVVDTGYGIKPEDLNKLFKSFSRIEEEKNHLIEGTGLGLSIVKRLLDLMDGTITVESSYGKGSTFTFKVPQEIESVISFAHVDDPETKSVLIYSETASVHTGLGKILDSLNISYTTALSIEELGMALDSRKFTHVFLEYSKYSSVWDYLKDIKDCKIVLLIGSKQLVDGKFDTASIRQPFNCLNVAEAINDVKKKEKPKKKREYFQAPDAKILIVDDNAINIQILAGLLNPHHMQVDSADSGKECLRRVKETEYDLILMDHMMPEMDGVETLQAIRALDGDYYKKVPVVVVTANAVSGVQEAMNDAGFQDYISKPINVDKLESTLIDYIPIEKIHNGELKVNEDSSVFSLFVPGVNVHKGIENNGGNFKNYLSILNSVLSEGNRNLQNFERFMRDADFRSYEIEAHSLKGIAEGIGADALADMAREQEAASRDGRLTDVRLLHNRFMDAFRKLLGNLEEAVNDSKKILPDDSTVSRGNLSNEEAINRLKVIYALLVTFEQELAESLVAEGNLYAMDTHYKSVFFDLKTYFDLCKYEDAEVYLKQKLKELGA